MRQLAVVLAVVAFLASVFVPREEKPEPGLSLDGLHPGMCKSRVFEILGPPSSQGPFKPGAGAHGSYAEWGITGGLTWRGSPTVTFGPTGRVLSIVGRQMVADGRVVAQVGRKLEKDTASLGVREDQGVYQNADGRLEVVAMDDNIVQRLVWSFADMRRNVGGFYPGDRFEDLQDWLGVPAAGAGCWVWHEDHAMGRGFDLRAGCHQGRVVWLEGSVLQGGFAPLVRLGEPRIQVIKRLGEPLAEAGGSLVYRGLKITCSGDDESVSSITLGESP